jgi:hypothetical protein
VKSRSAVKLSALRRICWEAWDPIGLRVQVDGDFVGGPADEYDRYMMVAFGMAQSDRTADDIASYLGQISSEHMGLGPSLDGGAAEQEAARRLIELARSLT